MSDEAFPADAIRSYATALVVSMISRGQTEFTLSLRAIVNGFAIGDATAGAANIGSRRSNNLVVVLRTANNFHLREENRSTRRRRRQFA